MPCEGRDRQLLLSAEPRGSRVRRPRPLRPALAPVRRCPGATSALSAHGQVALEARGGHPVRLLRQRVGDLLRIVLEGRELLFVDDVSEEQRRDCRRAAEREEPDAHGGAHDGYRASPRVVSSSCQSGSR